MLRVVLETLDDIRNWFALIADLIDSCEEWEPTGRPTQSLRAESKHLVHWAAAGGTAAHWVQAVREMGGESHLQPSLKRANKGDEITHLSTMFLVLRM